MHSDPFVPVKSELANRSRSAGATVGTPQATPSSSSQLLSSMHALSLADLPTCPVCLEKMDDTMGLATIFCQHVFHCACLQKWQGSGCPVCRYTQDDTFSRSYSGTEEDACSICGMEDNLWIWYVPAMLRFTFYTDGVQLDLRSIRLW